MAIDVIGATKRMGQTIHSSVIDNAVVTKEFRTRMRGWKPFALMGAYVLLLTLVAALCYWRIAEDFSSHGYRMQSLGDLKIGLELFMAITVTQVVLLTFVLPSLTASSVTQEIEKKTIDMLALSRLTSGKIVIGKQLSGFLYAVVLLASSIPLAGLCIMLGGISPAEILVTYLLMITWSFMFTAAGVMWSTLFQKTAAATLCSYGICLGYMLLTSSLSSSLAFSVSRGSHGGLFNDCFAFGLINPVAGPYLGLRYSSIGTWHIPTALICGVFQIVVGALGVMLASSHVCYRRAERPLSIRLTLIGLTAASAFVIAANSLWPYGIGYGASSSNYFLSWLSVMSICLLVVLMLAAASFASGAIRSPRNSFSLSYGFSLRKVFTNDLGGSIGFMSLWTIITYGMMGLGFVLAMLSGGALYDPKFWTPYWQIGVAILAIVIGTTALGILFSSMVKLRRNVLALMVALVVLVFLIYPIMMMSYESGGRVDSPIYQVAALWPCAPVIDAVGDWNYGMPHLAYKEIVWLASAATYSIIAVLALAGAGHLHSKGKGVQEED